MDISHANPLLHWIKHNKQTLHPLGIGGRGKSREQEEKPFIHALEWQLGDVDSGCISAYAWHQTSASQDQDGAVSASEQTKVLESSHKVKQIGTKHQDPVLYIYN